MVWDLARLVSARSLAELEWMPAVETRAFVSSTIFCLLVTALSWRASDSLLTQAAAKTLEQAWLVQRVPIHARRPLDVRYNSSQVCGRDRPGLVRLCGGCRRAAAGCQCVPVASLTDSLRI